jgi:hypothetical protein
VERQVLEVGVRAGPLRHLGDVQVVVDVAVEPEARLLHRLDRLAGEGERDRLVQEPLARGRVDDGGSLVTDERRLDPRRLGVGEHGAVHAPRREHDVDARFPGGRERCARTGAEDAVLPDEGAVQVARERGDVAREAVGEGQLVDSTTYCATSAICCSES